MVSGGLQRPHLLASAHLRPGRHRLYGGGAERKGGAHGVLGEGAAPRPNLSELRKRKPSGSIYPRNDGGLGSGSARGNQAGGPLPQKRFPKNAGGEGFRLFLPLRPGRSRRRAEVWYGWVYVTVCVCACVPKWGGCSLWHPSNTIKKEQQQHKSVPS